MKEVVSKGAFLLKVCPPIYAVAHAVVLTKNHWRSSTVQEKWLKNEVKRLWYMPAWYPPRLDPWQLTLKYSNSATELPGDLVTRLEHGRPFARSWVWVPPWVTVSFFSPLYFFLSHWLWLGLRSDCQVWNMSKIWACASCFALAAPPWFVQLLFIAHGHVVKRLRLFCVTVSYGRFTLMMTSVCSVCWGVWLNYRFLGYVKSSHECMIVSLMLRIQLHMLCTYILYQSTYPTAHTLT